MDTAEPSYAFLTPSCERMRGSMAAQVAAQLRDAIISLKLMPGTMLDKAQICARLGVSRSPVAEAFARLEAEGLLEILPQRGTVVAYLSMPDVAEYIFIRKALEGEAVRLLAQRQPREVLDVLIADIEAQRAVAAIEDRHAFHTLDLQFHEHLLSPLEYKRMKAMVDTARNNLDRARQMTNTARRIPHGVEEHAEIVELIAGGKPERAARAMHRHLDGMISELEALAAARPELFMRPPQRRQASPIIRDLATIRRLPST